jgi:uncharacterized protein
MKQSTSEFINLIFFSIMQKFEIFLGVNRQFYFRFKASNGQQILASEAYTTKANCQNGIASVKRLSPYDSTYRRIDSYANFRFNMVAENGEIIAKSSEGYVTAQGRENAIGVVKREAATAPIIDLT